MWLKTKFREGQLVKVGGTEGVIHTAHLTPGTERLYYVVHCADGVLRTPRTDEMELVEEST